MIERVGGNVCLDIGLLSDREVQQVEINVVKVHSCKSFVDTFFNIVMPANFINMGQFGL